MGVPTASRRILTEMSKTYDAVRNQINKRTDFIEVDCISEISNTI